MKKTHDKFYSSYVLTFDLIRVFGGTFFIRALIKDIPPKTIIHNHIESHYEQLTYPDALNTYPADGHLSLQRYVSRDVPLSHIDNR
jgi:hypothetical protein